jgi:hypothetical protein
LSTLRNQLFTDTESGGIKTLPPAARGRKGRRQRGALTQQILAALKREGKAGARVAELAAGLGAKTANLHAWFHSTARRIPNIVKMARGRYRLDDKASAAPAKASVAASAKTPTKRSRQKAEGKKSRRGELSAKIQAALASAGNKGMTIKDLSKKTGANYRNISVWFVTTGKNFPKIKKVGPAHYKLVA